MYNSQFTSATSAQLWTCPSRSLRKSVAPKGSQVHSSSVGRHSWCTELRPAFSETFPTLGSWAADVPPPAIYRKCVFFSPKNCVRWTFDLCTFCMVKWQCGRSIRINSLCLMVNHKLFMGNLVGWLTNMDLPLWEVVQTLINFEPWIDTKWPPLHLEQMIVVLTTERLHLARPSWPSLKTSWSNPCCWPCMAIAGSYILPAISHHLVSFNII